MRRVGGLWPEVTGFANLLRASNRAARGKARQHAIAQFMLEREPLLLELRRELLAERYRPAALTTFEILDPKPRTISVAPFRDRVVHHAIIDVLEPIFDRRMIHASFACRRGKGTHAALDHAQRLVRRHRWFLKMDVESFFASIPHAVVLATIARMIKGPPLLRLINHVIQAGDDGHGRGLPIGNLTSQWFANLTLGSVDRLVVEQLRMPGYARYMDDFVSFADDRGQLRELRARIEAQLARLGLRAKASATMLAPTRDGLPFLGFVLFPAVRRIRPANRKRTVQRWKYRLWQYRRGDLDERALADCMRSVMAHLEHGTTRGWRRRWSATLEGRGPM
ncbi:MAG: reverse transcriptase/maturase family protein [Enhygromyxa sp.]